MNATLAVAMLLYVLLAQFPSAADSPLVLKLWPGQPPDEHGGVGPERVRMSPGLDRKQVEVTQPTRLLTGVTIPTMTVLRPTNGIDTGTFVLICPGGGYWDLYWELEGEEVAAWLNSLGITGVILKYRVPRRSDEPKAEPARRPLQDAQRALRLLRIRAEEWHIRKIGIIGFSAGGHLSFAAATAFDQHTYEPVDETDRVSCRPDFVIVVYPGYLRVKDRDELFPRIRVPANTPPIFLVHGDEDIISPPGNSVLTYLALRRAGVSAELHVYANTTHDFGVRRNERSYSRWTESCVYWMRENAFLPEAAKISK